MKKNVCSLLLTVGLAMNLCAQMGMGEPRSIEAIVAEMEKQQGVTAVEQVAVDKVPQKLLEELGDAVMDVIIGNHAMHERMDRMLGGDGSPRLSAFHTDLGQQYLENGGLNGVSLGGPWGMGRYGMMWGYPGLQSTSKQKTIEGPLSFSGRSPAVLAGKTTYLLDFPEFYYYAYTDGIKPGAQLKLEGWEFAGAAGGQVYFSVTRATINGKVYDFTDFKRGMMGRGPRAGMMGGPRGGMMGGGQ